ncbi:hypothetical protein SAMN04489760_12026 [Syntrophus gentianae]|uniref:FAD-dependent oxidoreductase 2 FAD binding domain-containing protein n=1 Tax=Syntrophus gentianae TaxID=43775 RepID=A0A1H7Z6H3_9BACT|nr:FAD-binding protein [Syntrophus gentianae]SEM53148.1 hypothetical protein SAMN04489760_12026 [Syntrophus gentianae]
MRLKIIDISLALGDGEEKLKEAAAGILGVSEKAVLSLDVLRKSLDARRNRPPFFVYALAVTLSDFTDIPNRGDRRISVEAEPSHPRDPQIKSVKTLRRSVVVGSGPAGLFAALVLARSGAPVLLVERGKSVPERVRDVQDFWEKGIFSPESHVHFGEGGAGTFSDGKLTSRVKNPLTAWVKKTLVEMGAPADILIEAKPHIGTDRLRKVVVQMRRELQNLGAEIRFNAKMTDLVVHQGKIAGMVINDREEIATEQIILAIGQSADDSYRMLLRRGVRLAPKPFAAGFRIEHPQALINEIQYGPWVGRPELPPAEYVLTTRIPDLDRGVYTFCMCPGGRVIGCSSGEGGVITNGMSFSRRDGPFANSAVVANIRTEDFAGKSTDPLCGLSFRRRWEEEAYALGGGNYFAPAQRLVDFLKGRPTKEGMQTSFLPGVFPASLNRALPGFAVEALKRGLTVFNEKMPGFITGEAVLIGVETRTSSPVRIVRGKDGQSVSIQGLFPCGEGAGYAGGIVSSALDGIRAAQWAIMREG